MVVNQSTKASRSKSLQLLVWSAVSVGLLGIGPAFAQAPVTGAAPAAPTSTASPVAPATPVAVPAQVAPATPAAPAKSPAPARPKPGINVYNGTNASTLEFSNANPLGKKPTGPVDPWKMTAIVESNPTYTVDVKYPQFDPIKGSDPSKLNDEIKRYVSAQIDAARAVMPPKMLHIEGPKPLSYIKGVCNVSIYNQHLCSMTVDLTQYAFQSAHPVESLTTFNYRLDSNQQFALKDIFRTDFKFVPTISKICVAKLSEGLDEEGTDWVRRGAAPEDKNFVKFQITPLDLQIVFDPYTIDNGADGYKRVPIVWDRLRANISLDVPFHKLVAR